MPDATRPIFYYDTSSPYAYLTAARIDELVPVAPRWCPVSFGFVLRSTGRRPWSFAEDRDANFAEISARAAARGLPPVVYPPGWPAESYSLHPLRALVFASRSGRERELSLAFYAEMFARGRALDDPEHVVAIAARAGFESDEVRTALGDEEIKGELAANTEVALSRGLVGVPTVAVGDQLFWGDDRLEDAAAAVSAGVAVEDGVSERRE